MWNSGSLQTEELQRYAFRNKVRGCGLNRVIIAAALCGAVSVGFAADPAPQIYGQELLLRVAKSEPTILSAAMLVTPAASGHSVVIASTDPSRIGQEATATDQLVIKTGKTDVAVVAASKRIAIRLPLQDVSGDPIGVLSLEYAPGGDPGQLQHSAEHIRDALHRRISHAANLSDPYPYDPQAPTGTYAQQLVDAVLEAHPEIEIFAIHATPPDSDYNIIAGSNIGRIGKKADNDDMRVVYTAKPNLEVNSTGKRFEVETQLHDHTGNVIGAMSAVYGYKDGDNKQALHASAIKIERELAIKIPDSASLFKPAS
jgi:hypothetical protein